MKISWINDWKGFRYRDTGWGFSPLMIFYGSFPVEDSEDIMDTLNGISVALMGLGFRIHWGS